MSTPLSERESRIRELLPQKRGDEKAFWSTKREPLEEPQFMLLGTGTSEGVPIVSCLIADNASQHCVSCWSAHTDRSSRNRRRNTSAVLRLPATQDGDPERTLLIDCGKFFYDQALTVWPSVGLGAIDALLLTHEHFDAIGGMDNLRDWTLHGLQDCVQVHCRQRVLDTIGRAYPYLVSVEASTGSGQVPSIAYNIIDEALDDEYDCKPFVVPSCRGLRVTPLPVAHGTDMVCLGFRIGDLAYLSDCVEIPDRTKALIEGCSTLVLDALLLNGSHNSHFCLPQALDFVCSLDAKPQRVVLVGMNHSWEHTRDNAMLKEVCANLPELEGITVELGWDGQHLSIGDLEFASEKQEETESNEE